MLSQLNLSETARLCHHRSENLCQLGGRLCGIDIVTAGGLRCSPLESVVYVRSQLLRITLTAFNGKPVPTLSHGLTLNTIISVLATSSKAALMFVISSALGQLKWLWFSGDKSRRLLDAETFDEAARGPPGSFSLLTGHMK